ncbi:unnamed protein product, partial [Amoebophrya sp. A120]
DLLATRSRLAPRALFHARRAEALPEPKDGGAFVLWFGVRLPNQSRGALAVPGQSARRRAHRSGGCARAQAGPSCGALACWWWPRGRLGSQGSGSAREGSAIVFTRWGNQATAPHEKARSAGDVICSEARGSGMRGEIG